MKEPTTVCRSIKVLRTPEGLASKDEIHQAALQFVRKVSGFRAPSPANAEAFERAVASVAEASRELLGALPPKRTPRQKDSAAAGSIPPTAK